MSVSVYSVVYQSIWKNYGDDNGTGGTIQALFVNDYKQALTHAVRANLGIWSEILEVKKKHGLRRWGPLERCNRERLRGRVYDFVQHSLQEKRVDFDMFMQKELSIEQLEHLLQYLMVVAHEPEYHPEFFREFCYYEVQVNTATPVTSQR